MKYILTIFMLLALVSPPAYSATYELAISKRDEADLASGAKRKKEGDIVCVLPGGSEWGPAPLADYLIVTIESFLSLDELREKLMQPGPNGAANRFKVDYNQIKTKIPSFNLNKARNQQFYQPFKTIGNIFSANPQMKQKDREKLDTGPANTEKSIPWTTKDIIYDKQGKIFILPADMSGITVFRIQ